MKLSSQLTTPLLYKRAIHRAISCPTGPHQNLINSWHYNHTHWGKESIASSALHWIQSCMLLKIVGVKSQHLFNRRQRIHSMHSYN